MTTPYDLNSVLGMIILGLFCTIVGIVYTAKTLAVGKVAYPLLDGKALRYKLKPFQPLFNYWYAFVFTVLFGPGLILLGLVTLATLIYIIVF